MKKIKQMFHKKNIVTGGICRSCGIPIYFHGNWSFVKIAFMGLFIYFSNNRIMHYIFQKSNDLYQNSATRSKIKKFNQKQNQPFHIILYHIILYIYIICI